MRRRALNLLIMAFSALPCISASMDTLPAFNWEIDTIMKDQPVSFHFTAKVTDRPVFTLRISAYTDINGPIFANWSKKYDYTNQSGYVTEDIELPATFTAYDTFYFTINQQGIIGGGRLGQVFNYSAGFNATAGRVFSYYTPEENAITDPKRFTANSTPTGFESEQEQYRFFHYQSELASSSSPRHISLSKMHILYRNTAKSVNLANTAKAYINVYSDPYEYPIQPTINGGSAYVRIPLRLKRDSSSDIDDFCAYVFETQAFYYYHRRSLKMATSPSGASFEWFTSRDFFIRAGLGHDAQPFSGDLFIENLGDFKDSFRISINRDLSDNAVFGSCEDSTYCIVIGKEPNTNG